MNPERAQMLREIRREYCGKCEWGYFALEINECKIFCGGFNLYLKDLFAEAEAQTEPENENGSL